MAVRLGSLVRRDSAGLYVRVGGVTARPGSVGGYGHVLRMDDGGLSEGDRVRASHVAGTPLVRIRLPDGRVTRWHAEGADRDRFLEPEPLSPVWDDSGRRVFSPATLVFRAWCPPEERKPAFPNRSGLSAAEAAAAHAKSLHEQSGGEWLSGEIHVARVTACGEEQEEQIFHVEIQHEPVAKVRQLSRSV